jgi:hypothetical protein
MERILGIAALAALAFASGPLLGAPGQDAPPALDLPAPGAGAAEEAIDRLVVVAAYRRLEEFASFGGGPRFLLGDFRNLRLEEFDRIQWRELVDMPGGASLAMIRSIRRNENTGEARVFYQARWEELGDDWQTNEAAGKATRHTVAQVFEQVAGQQPELSQARRATLFRVKAQLGERERSYRAAFVWVPAKEGEEAAFIALDNVTQGVEEAAREPLPKLTDLGFLLDSPDDARELAARASCVSWTNFFVNSQYAHSTSGHGPGGFHHGSLQLAAQCSCSASCVSNCSMLPITVGCADTGVGLPGCHKIASSSSLSSNTSGNGRFAPAGCAGGLGCVMRSCLFCACGLSVGVNINGLSVSFTTDGSPQWSGNLSWGVTCPACYLSPIG